MTRVLFVEGAPAPYRVDFWNEFGRSVDLTVWSQAPHEEGQVWDLKGLGDNFAFEVLPGKRLGEDKYLNPSIRRRLKAHTFDACIMSLNCSPSEILATRWLRSKNLPIIFKSDGGFPHHTGNPMKEWVKHRVFPKADLWMSSGSNCTEYLAYYGADRERIVEYPFSVRLTKEHLAPLTHYERETLRQRNGLTGVVFFNAGQFIHRKGNDVLLEAYRRLGRCDATLLLIGAGEEKESYEAFVKEHGLRNVIIKPFVQMDELTTYYKLADVYVFPTRYDIYGLVINEAMMFGLPVISTRRAGAAYGLVEDGETGFMVDSEDPEQLAGRMKAFLGNEGLRVEMGNKGRQAIVPYTLENMSNCFVDACQRGIAMKGEEPSAKSSVKAR